jgi:hypothetical protein
VSQQKESYAAPDYSHAMTFQSANKKDAHEVTKGKTLMSTTQVSWCSH